MRGNVETSRKHGPFDTRWPCLGNARPDRSRATPTLHAAESDEALDWDSFSTRHFLGRRRHDSETLSAYAAYRQGREWRETATPHPVKLRLVASESQSLRIEAESEESGAQRLRTAVAELESWEGEGGFVPSQT